jgi:hypothetical protein
VRSDIKDLAVPQNDEPEQRNFLLPLLLRGAAMVGYIHVLASWHIRDIRHINSTRLWGPLLPAKRDVFFPWSQLRCGTSRHFFAVYQRDVGLGTLPFRDYFRL